MSAIVSNPSTQQLERGQVKLWMVLVGVNHYQDSQILDLKYCANDCKELAETLTIATQQFQETEIIALYDGGDKPPNLSEIIISIQQFRLAKPEDTVLFYFSGHGYLDSNNRPILCVTDTSLEDLAGTGLKLDTLLNELRQCKAQRQLVWLDACQEREQQDNRIGQNPTGQLLAVLEQQAEQSQDFYAMLSCNKTERSWEIPELRHGLFTYCLIEGLGGKAANAEGKIDADSLFKYVERNSKKFIEYKKNPLNEDSFSKGMLGSLKESSTKLKVKRLPFDASQTPQRIARGGGELIIGLATPSIHKKALIVDKLSSSEADISLCRILQARGSYAVDYYYCSIRDKQRRNLQQVIASYLREEIKKPLLLYLAGTIESTNSETYELVCNQDTRINLNWLGQQLQDSLVKEIIIIADILDTSGTTKSLNDILQLSQDKSLCLITATTSVPNSRKFLHQLVTVLETAGESEREFWVSELITQLQIKCSGGRDSQPDINLKLWLSGSTEVMEILSVEVQRSHNEIFEIEVCPYKSLEAFTQDDTYFFQGREELIAEIIEKLQSTSFLAVVGASGSGKSSVVRAGVIPQLVTEGLFDFESEQYKSCQSWVMLLGDNPLAALAKTLAPDNPDFLEGVLHLGVDSLVEWLRQQPKEISVLVIDQFEELFTLTAETDRVNFISLILGTIKKARGCFKVIITLRSDFLNECLGMSELAPLITKSQVLVPSCRLEDEQYRQIIAKPAQKVGLEVEDGLVALLLGELKEGSLPLLQYALEELWHKRSRGKLTLKDYQQYIGKLGKFLSNKAQATYNNLSEAQQKCAQSIFLSLVFLVEEQGDSNKDTRRRLPVSKLSINKYKNVFDSTLQALIDARLIVVSGEENNLYLVKKEQLIASDEKENQQKSNLAVSAVVKKETISSQSKDKVTVEIAHEILLRDWEALKWWLDENREKYRLIREINQKADEWEKNGKLDGFLLSKGALAKYEEFYTKYADDLSGKSNEFVNASIQARDKDEKLAKRRQRQIFGGLTVGLVTVSLVAIIAIIQWQKALVNQIRANIATSEALLGTERNLDALIVGLKAANQSKKLWILDKKTTNIQILGALQNIFNRLKEFNRLKGQRVSFSPDGRMIVSSSSSDGIIRVCDIQGKLLYSIRAKELLFSPDSKTIASVNWDNTIKLWNLQGNLLHTLQGERVVFSPDGQTIASVGADKTIKLWSRQGQLLYTLESHTKAINSVVFSPDGKTIASAGADKTIKLWSRQGQLLYTLEGHTEAIHSVVFSPDGKTIASAGWDKTIKLWNLQGNLLHTVQGNKVVFSPDGQTIALEIDYGNVKLGNLQGKLLGTIQGSRIVFSPDSNTIASASVDGKIKLWNLQGKLLLTLENHTEFISSIAFSPNGQILASANLDENINLWNIKEHLLDTLEGHTEGVSSLAFSPDEEIIASVDIDKIMKLWNFKKGLIENIQLSPSSGALQVAFSPNGKTIASAGKDKTIKLWNLQGDLLGILKGHIGWVQSVAFSPDGKTIASASGDKTIKLWNYQGELLKTINGHSDDVYSVAFSPDGKTIASASGDKTIKLWNYQGELLKTINGHSDDVYSVAFSPDGKTIASASGDKTIKLWDLKGHLLHTFQGHTSSLRSVAFSPDGKTIASASGDKTIKLWDLKGHLLYTFQGHTDLVFAIAFSPDGKTLASASGDKTIKLWSLDLDYVMGRGCDWARGYLTNNPNVSEEDQKICDGIGSK
ncbi:WD-40 repeat-containing protein [Kalymmatonema gypsitolerans NIES-4073]|nr:WD-40 repeat-containing protein [Scytonema sp. NIES-4073]